MTPGVPGWKTDINLELVLELDFHWITHTMYWMPGFMGVFKPYCNMWLR